MQRIFPSQRLLLLEDVNSLLYGQFRKGLFLLGLTNILNILILIGIDHLLASFGPLPLLNGVLPALLLMRRFLLLLGGLFLEGFFSDVLISKVYEVALVALLRLFEDVGLELMGVEHVFRLLLDLVAVVVGGLVHHSYFVLLVLIHELLFPI